jgi:small-conductance mechanosensitive channel/CRP-like cAMP-binding protein
MLEKLSVSIKEDSPLVTTTPRISNDLLSAFNMASSTNRTKSFRSNSFVAGLIVFAALFQAIANWPVIVQRLELQVVASIPEYLRMTLNFIVKNSGQLLVGAKVFIWIVGAFLANRIISRFFWDGLVANSLGRPVPSVLKDLGMVFVYIISSVCIAAAVFNQSIAGFLATLGAGSVVLGFALRGLLSDVFTGLAVNFDNNFAIGDWLIVPSTNGTGGTFGKVDEISWRCTRLTCEDGTTMVVPNSILGEEKIVNISRPSVWTRYQVEITIDYSVPVERARHILMASLQSVTAKDGFSKDQAPKVLVGKTGKRGVEYLLRDWIHPWHPLSPSTSRDLVLSAALQHLQTAGINPAYTKEEVYYEPLPAKHFQGHTVENKVALLSRITLFERLAKAELKRVAEEMERIQLSPGETLFRRNEEGNSLFILIEGLLNVQIDLKGDGTEQTVGQLSPGDFFGEMSLLTGEPRSATIQAHTNVVVYEIYRPTVMRLIEERPEISESMSRAVAKRQMALEQARSQMADSDAAAKVQSITRQLMGKMKNFFQSRSEQ